MSFKIRCDKCEQKIEVGETWIGKQAECPNCNDSILISAPEKINNSKSVGGKRNKTSSFNKKTKHKNIMFVFGGLVLIIIVIAFALSLFSTPKAIANNKSGQLNRLLELFEENNNVSQAKIEAYKILSSAIIIANTIKSKSDKQEAFIDILKVYIKAKDFRSAMNILFKIENNLRQNAYMVDIAKEYINVGNNETAGKILSFALNMAVYHYDFINIADAYVDIEEKEKAFQILSYSLQKEPNTSALKGIARVYIKADDFQRAINVINKIHDKGDKATAYRNVAEEYVKLGDNEKACKLLASALIIASSMEKYKSNTVRTLAIVYAKIGDLKTAMDMAASTDGGTGYDFCDVIDSYAESKNIKAEALEEATKFVNNIEKDYDKSLFLCKIAEEYIKTGYNEKAFHVLASLPVKVNYKFRNIASLYVKAGDFYRATEIMKKIDDKGFAVLPYLEMSEKYIKINQRAKAIEAISQALKNLNSSSYLPASKVDAFIEFSEAYAKAGEKEKSCKFLASALMTAQAIEIKHDKTRALCEVVNAYIKRGENEKACQVLSSVLIATSHNRLPRVVQIYATAGNFKSAIEISNNIDDKNDKVDALCKVAEIYLENNKK